MTTCSINSLHFTLQVTPIAQGRPRATVIAGHPHLYDPESSRVYKERIRKEVTLALLQSGENNRVGKRKDWVASCVNLPVRVDLVFYMPVPSRWPKAQKALAEGDNLPHLKKPDCDNLAKAVLDACTGILWHDDNQIFSLQVKKFYSLEPRVEITVKYETNLNMEAVS